MGSSLSWRLFVVGMLLAGVFAIFEPAGEKALESDAADVVVVTGVHPPALVQGDVKVVIPPAYVQVYPATDLATPLDTASPAEGEGILDNVTVQLSTAPALVGDSFKQILVYQALTQRTDYPLLNFQGRPRSLTALLNADQRLGGRADANKG